MKKSILLVPQFILALFTLGCTGESKTVKVGLLHSLTGQMSEREIQIRDSELLAIKEINEAGGILGRQIKVIQEDGQSNTAVFAEKARKLIKEDKVATIFGCWTSASRKAVKTVVEEEYNLLWYPGQYEGMEASPNIMYMGSSPNQQIVPAVEYCVENFGTRIYFIGSNYIFPQTAEKIIKAQISQLNGKIVGEKFFPFNHADFSSAARDIKKSKPDFIINMLTGTSNQHFFKEIKDIGITAETVPVISFSITEKELQNINIENIEGNLVAWNCYQTTRTEENEAFVKNYKKEYTSEAGYLAVYMWAKACEKAGSFDTEAVRIAAKGLNFTAPEGNVSIDGTNQHLYRQLRIGKINREGLIDEIWATSGNIKPDPYLSTYEWARGL